MTGRGSETVFRGASPRDGPPPHPRFPWRYLETLFCQRAENGGLDPSWLDFAFWGRPDFRPEVPKHLF